MNVKKTFLTVAASLVAAAALGQSYSIDWHSINGGGGTSTGGQFSVSGAVGQPDAASQPMTGGRYSLTGGFWSIEAIQTPGAPLLTIEWQGANLRVFWPLPAAGFVLDQGLTATGAWSPVSFPYVTNSTDISISVLAPTGSRFYRLRR